MIVPIFAAFGQTIFMLLLGCMALFLILLVLVQRGRGGGLAGALGGMGGSSAFGAKAGDVFTKITAVSAMVWILLCIAATKMTPKEESLIDTGKATATAEAPSISAPPNDEQDAAGEAAPAEEGAAESEPATDASDSDATTDETDSSESE